jgi:AraC family transcriptional regulator of adaptative response/methylated-DNA-[protein]-cysteine methyltransferase
MTPSAFRRGGEGVEIHCTVMATELGKLLVATTPRGVCAVRFGESEAALLRELKRDFEAAEIQRDDEGLEPVANQIKQLLNGSKAPLKIPLDLRGTAFQQMVWKELRRIPAGQTRSYTEVAKTIGRPKAVRAVANACASNPVALVVPCHRVVQKDGSMAGYRWGVKRKKALLEKEHSAISTQPSAKSN